MAKVFTMVERVTIKCLERLLRQLEKEYTEQRPSIIQEDIRALKRVISMLRMAE